MLPSALEATEVTDRYTFLWPVKTKGHDAMEVMLVSSPVGEDKLALFVRFFYCGLVLPVSEFFDELMRRYGF